MLREFTVEKSGLYVMLGDGVTTGSCENEDRSTDGMVVAEATDVKVSSKSRPYFCA